MRGKSQLRLDTNSIDQSVFEKNYLILNDDDPSTMKTITNTYEGASLHRKASDLIMQQLGSIDSSVEKVFSEEKDHKT